jgi:hypothetical protein
LISSTKVSELVTVYTRGVKRVIVLMPKHGITAIRNGQRKHVATTPRVSVAGK